jgi:hypothetical protein
VVFGTVFVTTFVTGFVTCFTTGALGAFGDVTFTGAGALGAGSVTFGAGGGVGAVEGTRTVGTVTVGVCTTPEVPGTVSAGTLMAPIANTAKVAKKVCAAIRLRLPVLIGALCTSVPNGLNVQSGAFR